MEQFVQSPPLIAWLKEEPEAVPVPMPTLYTRHGDLDKK